MTFDIRAIVSHPVTRQVAIGVGGFAAGAVAAYVVTRSKVKKLREENRVVHEVAHNAHNMYVKEQAARVEKVILDEKDYVQILREAELVDDEPEAGPGEEGTPETVRQNVFAQASTEDDEWDYEAETKARNPDQPYVIHKDEFYGDERGFNQLTFTYYAGDDILADQDEVPIYNNHNVVGEMKFGHGSGDSKVVYVRNEKRREEYEIVRDDGLYSVEVKGLSIEPNDRLRGIQHSAERRFRPQE